MNRETQLKSHKFEQDSGARVLSAVTLHRYLHSFKLVTFSDYNVSLIYSEENRHRPITIQKVKSNAVL